MILNNAETEFKNITIKLNSQIIDSDIEYMEKNMLTGDFISNREMFNVESKRNINVLNAYDIQNGKYYYIYIISYLIYIEKLVLTKQLSNEQDIQRYALKQLNEFKFPSSNPIQTTLKNKTDKDLIYIEASERDSEIKGKLHLNPSSKIIESSKNYESSLSNSISKY